MKLNFEKTTFIITGTINTKRAYGCYNKKHSRFFGTIQWYIPFNGFAYFTDSKQVITAEVLREVAVFVTQLNKQ